MHVSNSSITIFKDCSQKYYFSHILKLEPIKKSWALIDGSALHSVLEAFYSHQVSQPTPTTNLIEKCVLMGVKPELRPVLSQVEAFYDSLIKSDEETDLIDYHRHLTMAMVAGYIIMYENDKNVDYQPELSGSIEIEACNDGKQTELEFRADALIKTSTGSIIKEYKTTSEWSITKYIERLLLDWQPTCYMYGFTKLGFDPQGVMYDIIRKPAIRKGSVESDKTFNERMVKVMITDALKGGGEYYHREFITRSIIDLQEFEQDLKRVIKDITYHTEQALWYKNPSRCSDFGGCSFKMLCFESDFNKQEELKNEFFRGKGTI